MRAQSPATSDRSARAAWRVATTGLAAADAAMVRLFLNLQARGNRVRWAQAEDDEAPDVVVVGLQRTAPATGTALVIWVLERDGPVPEAAELVLRRPVLYDDLAERMSQADDRLTAATAGSAADFADTASPDLPPDAATSGFATTLSGVEPADEPAHGPARSAPAPALVAQTLARLVELEQAQRRAVEQWRPPPPPVSDPAPPAPAPAAGPAPPTDEARAQLSGPPSNGPSRYQLVRWPPHEVLQRNPLFPRLAGFLGARPLSRAQLSEASGVDPDTCILFIATLRSMSLLHVLPATRSAASVEPPALPHRPPHVAKEPAAAVTATASTTAAAPVRQPASTASRAPLGAFIHRLRRRFGLG